MHYDIYTVNLKNNNLHGAEIKIISNKVNKNMLSSPDCDCDNCECDCNCHCDCNGNCDCASYCYDCR